MLREVDINDISDGKRYSSSDTVKIGCNDCAGCSKCCEHMDGLITLDPYDIYRMTSGESGQTFGSLINRHIEFAVDRGVLIPTLKMDEESKKCTFLREDGRCGIHSVRPGVCRLFPLGRLYEDGSFSYFLQKDECDYKVKTKVKIRKWLETPEIGRYEKYISDWHYFVRKIQDYIANASEEEAGQINNALIQIFFVTEYKTDFYEEFYARLEKVEGLL